MACTSLNLGGVELNPSMLWLDRHDSQNVAQSTVRTLGGGLVVFSQSLSLGEDITLQANQDSGWLTKSQVDSLITLARTAGAVYTLTVDGDAYDVIFKHDDPPAVNFRPLIPRLNMASTDYMVGTIKLLTV